MEEKIKIAILGTRGIPNQYGGFERCAEKVGLYLVNKGHDVTVYNPCDHPYQEKEWKGIKIKKIFAKEKYMKILYPFVFDYFSLKDAVKRDYDIILELGYSPSSLFYYLKKKTKAKIATNMDGLDWKRSKWNKLAKAVLLYSEKLAVEKSDAIIADNKGIQEYIYKKYKKESYCIPYGADLFNNPDEKYLKEYELEKFNYYMMVARLEPENNIEMVLDGYLLSGSKEPIVIVGRIHNGYGNYLFNRFKENKNIKFVGGIYDYEKLSSLRWFSKLYFHGHSVGGTNPALLEAMASNAYIAAHNNVFNRYVLGEDAFYFSNSEDVKNIIQNYTDEYRKKFITNNREKIKKIYNWETVSEQYLELFKEMLKK